MKRLNVMSKYDVNNYHVIFFDKKGSKLNEFNLEACGLSKAKNYSDSILIESEDIYSYVILRVICNSLD